MVFGTLFIVVPGFLLINPLESVRAFNQCRESIICDTSTGTLAVSLNATSTTSLAISWTLATDVTATSFTISYSNTDTQCFPDSNDIAGIAASETMYTVTDLQEGTEYSITVTAMLSDGGSGGDSLTATTMAAG